MAVTPADLLEPTGELSPADFPGYLSGALTDLMQGFITDATARLSGKVLTDAQRDQAITAWAYARGNRMILRRLSRTPASFSLANEGSQTILGEQIRTFKSEAKRWEDLFNGIIGDEPTPDDTPSTSAKNSYTW